MRRTLILGVIVMAAFALRVHLLGAQELRGDEGFTWNYILNNPIEIVARIIREGDPQPPLHYWIQWAWLQFTGDSEFAMRAWSAFVSLLLVPLMYQVGRRLWRDEIGLVAAGLTAIHPQQIWLAQDVRNMYQLALVALLISTLLLRKLLHATEASSTRGYWLGYVASGSFAMYSHYYSLFFLMAHTVYVVAQPSRRPFWRWATAGLAIAALVAPWAIIIIPIYLRGQLADPGRLSLAAYFTAALGDLVAGPAFSAPVKLALVAVGLLLAVVSTASLTLRSAHHLTALLCASIVTTFLGIYAIIAARATFNTFYLVFAYPAVGLLFAGGAVALYQRLKPLGLSVILVCAIIYSIGLRNHYYDPEYSKNRGMREVAGHLARAARPGDIYLTSTPDPAMVYYLRYLDLPFHLLPGQRDFEPLQVDAELDRLLTHRIWLVPATALDPNGYVPGRLLNTAILAEENQFNKMRLMLFLPPAEAYPLDARFSDGIRLIGYYLTPNRLTLIWTAEAQPAGDYTVFVHALAADGYNLIGDDSPPHTPTSQWRAGQIIVDAHEFPIPTERPITLVAGLYPSAAPADRLPLETESYGEQNAARIVSLNP